MKRLNWVWAALLHVPVRQSDVRCVWTKSSVWLWLFIVVAVGNAAVPVRLAAATIMFTDLGDYTGGSFGSAAMDPVTGQYYSRAGYGPGYGSGNVTVYANASDFSNHISSGSIALQSGGFYGTYFAVQNGELFGRALGTAKTAQGWPSDSSTAMWNLATGHLDANSSIPGMGGVNATDTFNWGGFSAVNWMQDSTGLYVLGNNAADSTWQLDKMDSSLGILQSKQLDASSHGYGFMIGGNLFTSSDFGSNVITQRFTFSSGSLAIANDVLSIPSSSLYIDNAFYDSVNDALYLHNASTGHFYRAENASQQFGITSSAVPEPSTLTLFGAGLLGVVACRRRSRALRHAAPAQS